MPLKQYYDVFYIQECCLLELLDRSGIGLPLSSKLICGIKDFVERKNKNNLMQT
jgi:hypothetical protein